MFRIGQLAEKTGLSTHTLRFYEQQNLLGASHRTPSGYRQYIDTDFQQALFIARAREAGFSLEEIRHLMSIRLDKDQHTCEEVVTITREKLLQVQRKIAELAAIKNGLEQMLDICSGGPEAATECSILGPVHTNYFFAVELTKSSVEAR